MTLGESGHKEIVCDEYNAESREGDQLCEWREKQQHSNINRQLSRKMSAEGIVRSKSETTRVSYLGVYSN